MTVDSTESKGVLVVVSLALLSVDHKMLGLNHLAHECMMLSP